MTGQREVVLLLLLVKSCGAGSRYSEAAQTGSEDEDRNGATTIPRGREFRWRHHTLPRARGPNVDPNLGKQPLPNPSTRTPLARDELPL